MSKRKQRQPSAQRSARDEARSNGRRTRGGVVPGRTEARRRPPGVVAAVLVAALLGAGW